MALKYISSRYDMDLSTPPSAGLPVAMLRLLEPISADHPCGEDMSFSDDFDRIAQHRRADDPSLDQGEWKTAIKVADWPQVRVSCERLLSTQTKDLRLLGWLTEALTHLQGFEGMADGLELCAQAIEAYWATIHPQPDAGDQEQRIGNLTWLLAQVLELTESRPLLDGGAGLRLVLREIEVARTRQVIHDPYSNQLAPEGLTAELLAKALKCTPPSHLLGNLTHVKRAQQALHHLQVVVDARLGADGPGFVAARQALEDVSHAAERLARDNGLLIGGAVANEPSPGDGASVVPALAPAHDGGRVSGAEQGGALVAQIQSREQALGQLRLVAEYFRKTEPHSPVAYLADKAVAWGNMPLHVWLRTVLKEGGSLAHVEELLGLEPPVEGTQG